MEKFRISKYVSYKEATRSQAAVRLKIDNTPNVEQLEAMKYVATEVFDKVRENFGVPLFVSSFFRSPIINHKVGGSASSQHCKGEAIDIDADGSGVTNMQVFNYIKENLVFDQLIFEYGTDENPAWVHVSRKKEGNRMQILRIK